MFAVSGKKKSPHKSKNIQMGIQYGYTVATSMMHEVCLQVSLRDFLLLLLLLLSGITDVFLRDLRERKINRKFNHEFS